MGTKTPHTCIPGLVWQKQARRFSQFELKVGELRFPIHFVCVSAALYHRGVRGRHFPLRWIWPICAPSAKMSTTVLIFAVYVPAYLFPPRKCAPCRSTDPELVVGVRSLAQKPLPYKVNGVFEVIVFCLRKSVLLDVDVFCIRWLLFCFASIFRKKNRKKRVKYRPVWQLNFFPGHHEPVDRHWPPVKSSSFKKTAR